MLDIDPKAVEIDNCRMRKLRAHVDGARSASPHTPPLSTGEWVPLEVPEAEHWRADAPIPQINARIPRNNDART